MTVRHSEREKPWPSASRRWVGVSLAGVLAVLLALSGCAWPAPAYSTGAEKSSAEDGAELIALHDAVSRMARMVVSVSEPGGGEQKESAGQPAITVAVLDFSTAKRSTPLGEHLSRELTVAISQEARRRNVPRLKVLTRTNIADLLKEQGLSMSDAFREAESPRMGRLLGADLLVTGWLTPMDEATHVSAQVVRVYDGVVLGGERLILESTGRWWPSRNAAPTAARASRVRAPVAPAPARPLPDPMPLLDVRTASRYLLESGDHEPKADIGILIRVGARDGTSDDGNLGEGPAPHFFSALESEGQRRPLNLCIVLDTSGSMESRGRLRAAKEAARRAVSLLRDDDRFCLISFNSGVDVKLMARLADARGREKALDAINSLSAGGKTNFAAALRAVERMYRSMDRAGLTHYVLFVSDGAPTVGTENPDELGELSGVLGDGGLSVHTVGVGEDLRIDTLEAIARRGNGRFHAARDEQALAELIPRMVDEAAYYRATDAILTFTPAPGMTISRTGALWRDLPGGGIAMSLGLIRRGEIIGRAVHVAPESGNWPTAGSITLGEVELTYLDAFEQPRTETAEVSVEVTEDADLYRRGVDLEAVADSHMLDLRATLKEAFDMAGSGKQPEAARHIENAQSLDADILSAYGNDDPRMAALRRLVDRTSGYVKELGTGEFTGDLRRRLYRDAVGDEGK